MKIDLKWSLWSADPDTWIEREPEKFAELTKRVESGERVTAYSSPKKEIRSGTVEMWKTPEGTYEAHASFHAEWDDARDQLDNLGLEEDDLPMVEEGIPRNDHGEPGVSCDGHKTSTTFVGLLKEVDEVEERLLRVENERWAVFEGGFKR